VRSGTLTTLSHSDMHAHNSFEQRNVVTPQETDLGSGGRSVTITFPPASVTKLAVTLA
jgi:alpha-L-arabinofuranosidase